MPQIASFWETILLGAQSYRGGAFRPHAALHRQVPLRSGHFERWLVLWRETVDELFEGERAELAKSHAERVARAFHARLEELERRRPAAGSSSLATGPLPDALERLLERDVALLRGMLDRVFERVQARSTTDLGPDRLRAAQPRGGDAVITVGEQHPSSVSNTTTGATGPLATAYCATRCGSRWAWGSTSELESRSAMGTAVIAR